MEAAQVLGHWVCNSEPDTGEGAHPLKHGDHRVQCFLNSIMLRHFFLNRWYFDIYTPSPRRLSLSTISQILM